MTSQKRKNTGRLIKILSVMIYTFFHTFYNGVINVFWSKILTIQGIIHPVIKLLKRILPVRKVRTQGIGAHVKSYKELDD
jgi:hypothetical protein